jgi:O-acetyl-ADP-ribose deacetylase (regulator of RNase III)
MELHPNISAIVADITSLSCDAIVNAANSSLLGGGGVDGAIHRAGGPEILKECRQIRDTIYPDGLPTGQAVATTAGNLDAKVVIHTVGPVYTPGKDQSRLLAECYKNSIKVAKKKGCASIAFPAISTGIYGYPKAEAARIAYRAVLDSVEGSDIKVLFVFHSKSSESLFIDSLASI